MMRTARVCLFIGLWGCACGVPPALGADDALVPSRADVPAYRNAGGGAGVARAAVGGRIPTLLRHAQAHGIAFRAGGRRLTFGVFVFADARGARRALGRLRSGRRRVGTALGGLERVRSARRTSDVAVAFRVGSAVGTVRLRGKVAGMPARAAVYAQSLAARLHRVLALTAWQRTLDGIHRDGSITPKLALRAFAIAYGPVPGVQRPTGPAGAPPAGTLAMQMVARVWDRLSAAQQAAVDRDLGAPHDAGSPPVASAATQVLTPDARYQALTDKYNAIYRAKLPGAPPVTIKAYKASEAIPTKPGFVTFADALPLNASGQWGVGAPAYCRVRVPPAGQAASPQFLELILAHETFHCFQFVLMANWRQRTLWVMEGMADWAAVTADPVPASVGAGNLKAYLGSPTTPLFARSYDSVGFWGARRRSWRPRKPVGQASRRVVGSRRSRLLRAGRGQRLGVRRHLGVGDLALPGRRRGLESNRSIRHPAAVFPGVAPEVVEKDAPLRSASYSLREYVVVATRTNRSSRRRAQRAR